MKGTYDFSTSLDRPHVDHSTSSTPGTGASTPGSGSVPNSGATSGAGTPTSVGFVSLSSLNLLEAKLKKKKSKSKSDRKPKEEEEEVEEGHEPEYLRYDPASGLDESKYAVLPNDWPYCVPYGVRHYCVWSRVSREESTSSFFLHLLVFPRPLPTRCHSAPTRCGMSKVDDQRVGTHSPPRIGRLRSHQME